MDPIEVPPDATPFKSRGETLYLSLGALEMRGLQREWGLTRSASDTAKAWLDKQIMFNRRLEGGPYEDKIAFLKHALTRWARCAGNGSGPIELTDEKVCEILDGLDPEDGDSRRGARGRIARITALHQKFLFECFSSGDADADDDEADVPKEEAAKGPESETPAEPNTSILSDS